MSALSDPLQVLIAGGGVAALETTLALQALAQDPISIELIAPEPEFVYRPLAVAEPFRVGETRRFPLSQLVEAAGATLCRGHVAGVDPDRRIVATDEGAERPYEVLVVALGARPREAVPDALTFSGPESGAALGTVLEETLAGEIRRIVFAVPGGVA
jgi:sulfide:quinone oxidoreductase